MQMEKVLPLCLPAGGKANPPASPASYIFQTHHTEALGLLLSFSINQALEKYPVMIDPIDTRLSHARQG